MKLDTVRTMLGCEKASTIRPDSLPKKASHKRMAMIIRSSAIHAAGCYTTTAIRKGARLGEYDGPRITKDEADTLYEDAPVTYLFGLGDGSIVIDGHSAAMFINHSCNPNCETEEIKGRVWITAIRNIKAGDEITYDYCLYDGGDEECTCCNCGTMKCRGTMYSKEEVKRRKAEAKKAAKSISENGDANNKKHKSIQ